MDILSNINSRLNSKCIGPRLWNLSKATTGSQIPDEHSATEVTSSWRRVSTQMLLNIIFTSRLPAFQKAKGPMSYFRRQNKNDEQL